MQHLLNISDLSKSEIETIFDSAKKYLSCNYLTSDKPLGNQTLVNIFFENSTRTRVSFELAAKHLGAEVINLQADISSLEKGESLLDTIKTLIAMHCKYFAIRHSKNNALTELSTQVGNAAHIINAGDGANHHPTQTLLDLFTIQQHKQDFKNIKISIMGDIKHSRVANSLIEGLKIMGSGDINLIAPENLLPEKIDSSCKVASIDEGLKDADVIVCLRIQFERLAKTLKINSDEYHRLYGLTTAKLKLAKPDAIVMHPGPINRGLEIASDVADGPQSVILEQVANGVAVRMAVLGLL